ncbi:MAG: ROK family protein, partial [Ruthenibacterium sp.]
MKFLNVEVSPKNIPVLDEGFVPLSLFFKNYQKGATKPLCIAVERSAGQIGTYETKIYGTPDMAAADAYYVDRLVKFLLWSWGGFKVTICGDDAVGEAIGKAYTATGSRAFDKGFMEQVYETEFIVACVPYDKKPQAHSKPEAIGRHMDGCRIGFDAGGSDRKVSAVIDGTPVYSEEVVWFPKTNADPAYHYQGIVEAFKTAASKMP